MAWVPAGHFSMGCDPGHNAGCACHDNELPLHVVRLDAYWIDLTEVTNAAYGRWVAVGACAPPSRTYSRTRTNYFGSAQYAEYPVIYVSAGAAEADCRWAGKRLPTKAEWEKAARGASDTRPFPWGDQPPTCDLVNVYFCTGEYCVGDTNRVLSYSRGASPFGVLDLTGNAWEWVAEQYSPSYYAVSPVDNPRGPATGEEQVVRGGGFCFCPDYCLRSGYRFPQDPGLLSYGIGFRCAMTADAPGGRTAGR
jgi:formylglycine-generating enzyme required for sulfatase activity